MPKTKISEFDVDPANNTDINSINIAEGCAPSGINNAIRQLMSDLKEFQTGAGGDPFNGAVNGTVGATTPASGAFTSLSASGAFAANGGATLGDASGDALTINSSAVSIPNGLNFDSNTLVIDATNNRVGVGTASPDALLQVSANNPTFKVTDTSTTGSVLINPDYFSGGADHIRSDINHLTIGTDAAKYVSLKTNNTERMRIDSSGNVGIGTSSPNSYSGFTTLTLNNASTGSVVDWNVNGTRTFTTLATATTVNIGSITAIPVTFRTGDTERMRIDSSGNLLVGTTSTSPTSGSVVVAGTATYQIMAHASGSSSGSAYHRFDYNSTGIGSITQNGTTGVLYNLTSDYRLKNDQQPLTGSKEFVMALQPKKWQWWDGSGEGVGFIAHEFMEVAKYSGNGEKDAVDENGNPVYQSIQPSSSEVMANLVSFIQEQQAIITDLKTRIETLESK